MWNADRKLKRLRLALERRSIDPRAIDLDHLFDVLISRGMPDRELNPLVSLLITRLEPPACPMIHCEHYGGEAAPMHCTIGKVPGRCVILKAYKKRKAARDKKKRDETIANRSRMIEKWLT